MSLLPWEQIERKVLTKLEEPTNPSLGSDPNNRPISELLNTGIINLNKPSGPTSHLTAEYVKRILKVKKAGHGGTLDPIVTGVLPVALMRATRIAQAFLKSGKEYVCVMRLHKDVEEKKLRDAIENFIGRIEQLPPVKSAVVRRLRKRSIYYLDILEIDGKNVLFRTGCQAGTYIRKLVHDIGLELGGAHMAELVRTKAGGFDDSDWVTLQDLEDAMAFYKKDGNEKFIRHCIQPMESGVKHLAKIWIRDSCVDSLTHGASLKVPGISKLHSEIKKGDTVAVMTLKNELVLVGTAEMSSEQIMGFNTGIAVLPESVFMQSDVYKIA